MAHDITETSKKSLVVSLIGKAAGNSWSIVKNVSGIVIGVTGLVTLVNQGYTKFMEYKCHESLKAVVQGKKYDISPIIDKVFSQEVGGHVLEGKYNMHLALAFGVAYCAWHFHRSEDDVTKVEIVKVLGE